MRQAPARRPPGAIGTETIRAVLESLRLCLALICLIPVGTHVAWTDTGIPGPQGADATRPQQGWTHDVRTVNAPYNVPGEEATIFWFGRVTPTENAVDVRLSYQEDHLIVRMGIIDRLLWFDRSPSPHDLTAWDAATLYLDTTGNTGLVPTTDSYRFEAQLSPTPSREEYQAAYQGNGNDWEATDVPFTSTTDWAYIGPDNSLNDGIDDRGWAPKFLIPYSTLGLRGPPAEGTIWALAIAVHDRDDAEGTPIEDQVWPEGMDPQRPLTWGHLRFGLPAYNPPPATRQGEITVRHGLDGATVTDADVGGSSICGAPAAPEYFPTWGELNWAAKTFVNIQNLGAISDWPCFSRYYVTFPLDALPADQVIISATLTLHLSGGAGQNRDPGPLPSLIQVLTVDEDWTESNVTWNNAPLAKENISATWVYPVPSDRPPEGIPYDWDVSRAVAEAYAAGIPLRLALYEADWAFHSGKYFHSSDVGDWNAEGRPTLRVVWGPALGEIAKSAAPSSGGETDLVMYTLSFLATGQTLALTDTLPAGIGPPGDLVVEGSSVGPSYNETCHCLTWKDSPPPGQEVTMRYTARIVTDEREALWNVALLTNSSGESSSASALVLANPIRVYLPLVLRTNPGAPAVGTQCSGGHRKDGRRGER